MSSLIRSKIIHYTTVLGLAALIVLLWPKLSDFVGYSLSVLRYPFVWAMTENENMLFIHGIVSGQNVYSLNNSDSFFYFVYPPLFHVIAAGLTKLCGFTILIPRLISVASLLSLIALLFMFFKEKRSLVENSLVTVVLTALAVSIALYAKYYILARVDMLAYALAFGSLYFAWQIVFNKSQQRSFYWLTGGLAVATIFTKQSAFFPLLVLAALTFFTTDRKNWFRFGGYTALALIAVFIGLQLVTAGGFWQSMTLASETYGKYLNSSQHLFKLQTAFITHYWPLLLGLPALAILQRRSFSLLVFVAIYVNFLVTGGNQGAEHNTLIPALFGILLVSKELSSLKPIGTWVCIALFALQIFILGSIKAPYLRPTEQDVRAQQTLIEQLQSSSQTSVLGDRVDYATILAGKESPLEASTHNVARSWSKTQPYAKKAEENLLGRMQNGQIDTAVVTITGFGQEELLRYIEAHGALVDTIIINYSDAPEFPHKVYRLH